jgi:transketolase
MTSYKEDARQARLKVLDMIYRAHSSHVGSCFSVVDILTVLFAIKKPEDQVILSAGWKAAAFYYFLAKEGLIPMEELDTYNQEGSRLIGLTEPGIPGVLFAGGSMQMGVPAAVGFALAKKLKGESGRVYCIMSDGELAGGMVYESILIARQHNLGNLTLIVDCNGLQAMGKVAQILDPFPEQHGMADGHNYKEIQSELENVERRADDLILFKTVKGKGVSWMEGNNLWHYKDLSSGDYASAVAELSHD